MGDLDLDEMINGLHYDSAAEMIAKVRRLVEYVRRLQQTNRRLNRRCQHAESAARQTLEQQRRAGPSFGRALANWGYAQAMERVRELEEMRDAMSAVLQRLYDGCPEARAILYEAGIAPDD